MPPFLYIEQSAAAQTAFANVADAAGQAELRRSVADLPGSFAKKLIKGKSFWYFQRRTPDGEQKQIYVGPDDEDTREIIERHQDPSLKRGRVHLQALTRAAIALGCASVVPKHARILRRLAEHGFFKSGSILVGTHAFLAYQNILGIRWTGGDTTLDLDFAHSGNNVSLALPTNIATDTRAAIDSLQMGLVPNSMLTSFKKTDEPDMDLDFLTSVGGDGDKPVDSQLLNIRLQPLPFMEFSMEATFTSTVLENQGPIVVNLPAPERYAVHKLIVHGERPQKQRTKSVKDLVQAASLFSYLSVSDPYLLRQAWTDAVGRGRGWEKRLMSGFDAMASRYPQIDFEAMVSGSRETGDPFEAEPEPEPGRDLSRPTA